MSHAATVVGAIALVVFAVIATKRRDEQPTCPPPTVIVQPAPPAPPPPPPAPTPSPPPARSEQPALYVASVVDKSNGVAACKRHGGGICWRMRDATTTGLTCEDTLTFVGGLNNFAFKRADRTVRVKLPTSPIIWDDADDRTAFEVAYCARVSRESVGHEW